MDIAIKRWDSRRCGVEVGVAGCNNLPNLLHRFSHGPNWSIWVAMIGLQTLGLNPDEVLKHGIRHEVYAMPIASNWR